MPGSRGVYVFRTSTDPIPSGVTILLAYSRWSRATLSSATVTPTASSFSGTVKSRPLFLARYVLPHALKRCDGIAGERR